MSEPEHKTGLAISGRLFQGEPRVVVEFPEQLSYLSFTPDQAEMFATALLHYAAEVRKKTGS
jgi:hypothetical protein